MSSNLYDQAIADAKKLKELAEKNATNKIIESIAPKIRMLIEQEIDDEMETDLDSMVDADGMDDDIDDLNAMLSSETENAELMQPSADLPLDSGEIELEDDDEDSEKNVTVNITVESRLDRRAKMFRKKAVDLVITVSYTHLTLPTK